MNFVMKHHIDPTIDFVFKMLFGAKGNEPIVIHFLNSILKPERKITHVTIVNPFNERECDDDKLSVVDVKVEDQEHHTYQIEIQLKSPRYIRQRMMLNWSQMYSKQIKKGDEYYNLKPVVSIWLLTSSIEEDEHYHHHYQLYDELTQKKFSDHCSIHLLELKKWELPQNISGTLRDEDLWPYFLIYAHQWLQLPEIANTDIMELAMAVLQHISNESEQYERYRARKRYQMDMASDKIDRQEFKQEQERRAKAEKRADEESKLRQAEQQRADKAVKENEVLLQELAQIKAKNNI